MHTHHSLLNSSLQSQSAADCIQITQSSQFHNAVSVSSRLHALKTYCTLFSVSSRLPEMYTDHTRCAFTVAAADCKQTIPMYYCSLSRDLPLFSQPAADCMGCFSSWFSSVEHYPQCISSEFSPAAHVQSLLELITSFPCTV